MQTVAAGGTAQHAGANAVTQRACRAVKEHLNGLNRNFNAPFLKQIREITEAQAACYDSLVAKQAGVVQR